MEYEITIFHNDKYTKRKVTLDKFPPFSVSFLVANFYTQITYIDIYSTNRNSYVLKSAAASNDARSSNATEIYIEKKTEHMHSNDDMRLIHILACIL